MTKMKKKNGKSWRIRNQLKKRRNGKIFEIEKKVENIDDGLWDEGNTSG